VSLSEAIDVMTNFANLDAKTTDGHRIPMNRREAMALQRLLADARITLANISQGVIRREGGNR
jgi:hypothetical protein